MTLPPLLLELQNRRWLAAVSTEANMMILGDPDSWRADVHDHIRAACKPRVLRDDLWRLADLFWEEPTDTRLLDLFWTTMAWGGLSRGRPTVQRAVMDTRSQSVPILRAAADYSRAGDIALAHKALHGKVPYLGPAFFTKFLWVTGDRDSDRPRALILDSRTTTAYLAITNTLLDAEKTDDYVTYCASLHEWSHDAQISPDDLEAALFDLGAYVGSAAGWARILSEAYVAAGLPIKGLLDGLPNREATNSDESATSEA